MDTAIQGLGIMSILLGLISGLLVLLLGVLGWIGVRIHTRLDEISVSLSSIERDLRGELTSLDRRISRIEGHYDAVNGKG